MAPRTLLLPAAVPATLLALALTVPAGPARASDPAGGPTGAPPAAPTPADGAVWPLGPHPEVVSRFDPPASRWGAGHRGVDLLGTVGQPVRAARSGTVTFAGRLAGRGVVVVSHGETRTTYEPLAAAVAVGDAVDAGSVLGRLELLGSHCLPLACLHWGLLEGERYLDPLTLVGRGPVRLLPLFGEGVEPPRDLPAVSVGSAFGAVPQLPGWRPLGEGGLFRG